MNAAEALRKFSNVSPRYEVPVVADVIEMAIKEPITECQGIEREREAEVPTAAELRVARALTASPPVIYSLAAGTLASSFVSKDIRELFGHQTDHFQHPNFWGERIP